MLLLSPASRASVAMAVHEDVILGARTFDRAELMKNSSTHLSRRAMLRRCTSAAALLALNPRYAPLFAAPAARRFKIGACDWSIGKMGDPAAFEVAKQIGLDGVQVSLGTAANHMQLRQPGVQRNY